MMSSRWRRPTLFEAFGLLMLFVIATAFPLLLLIFLWVVSDDFRKAFKDGYHQARNKRKG